MKRPKVYAAVFALAAGAVWLAEVLWLRRALDASQADDGAATLDDPGEPPLVRAEEPRRAS